jgi:small subunit ribosomal protein S19
MARSLKKDLFQYKLDKKVQENIAGGNKGVVKTWSRVNDYSRLCWTNYRSS